MLRGGVPSGIGPLSEEHFLTPVIVQIVEGNQRPVYKRDEKGRLIIQPNTIRHSQLAGELAKVDQRATWFLSSSRLKNALKL